MKRYTQELVGLDDSERRELMQKLAHCKHYGAVHGSLYFKLHHGYDLTGFEYDQALLLIKENEPSN